MTKKGNSNHPLMLRKRGLLKLERNYELKDVVFMNGGYTIKNVPHVVFNKYKIGLEYGVEAKVEATMSHIFNHMELNELTEYDYNDWNN